MGSLIEESDQEDPDHALNREINNELQQKAFLPVNQKDEILDSDSQMDWYSRDQNDDDSYEEEDNLSDYGSEVSSDCDSQDSMY